MSLQGLPDFQRPLIGDGFQIYYPFEAAGAHIVVPSALEIAVLSDGTPDFVLNLVRGSNPMMPPVPYGVLDFRLQPAYRMDDALVLARQSSPLATLGYPSFTSGLLQFKAAADTADFPPELKKPIPLGWNGLGTMRFTMRLSQGASAFVRNSLHSGIDAMLATALLEMEGVSPRVPLKVRFSGRELGTAIGAVSREARMALFRGYPNQCPVQLDGALTDDLRDDFAEAMADLVTFPPPDGAETVECDLSEPRRATRGMSLTLNPLAAARRIGAALVHENVVPALQTGGHQLSISANLPPERSGMLLCGVVVRCPPFPPFRMQAINVTAEFHAPGDAASVVLRLSPKEPLRYTCTPFAVAKFGDDVQRLDGPPSDHTGEHLRLTVADFPVEFLPVEASRALLELAAVSGTVRGQSPFSLSLERPSITHVLPKGTTGVSVDIEATARNGSGVLRFTRNVVGRLSLDLSSFPEFGPRTVQVECDFTGSPKMLEAIDLMAESSENVGVLPLTPAKPAREWAYFAKSPFQPGYRFRRHGGPDEKPAEWSEVKQPGAVLKIVPS